MVAGVSSKQLTSGAKARSTAGCLAARLKPRPFRNMVRLRGSMRRIEFGVFVCGALCAAFVMTAVAGAQVKPNALFSDHAVLQSGMDVPVWGAATPGEKVTVSVDGRKESATTDAAGKWMVRL